MAHIWNHKRAAEHIEAKLDQVREVSILDYKREMSLENIPANKAYRVDATHLYADIVNLDDMLNVTAVEGEQCHKRTGRFLNLHFRAVHRILARCDALRVDFHNQRLHALVAKPYNSEDDAEANRVQRAVAIAQLVIDVTGDTGDAGEQIPGAKVRVGIDTGETLAVNNGRRGGREPLFLGDAANHSAKLASNASRAGIYLTNAARLAIGLDEVDKPEASPLTVDEIADCQDAAKLGVTAETIINEWEEDLENNPIGAFQFSRHTPPLSTLQIADLTPGNSRRQEAVSLYADLDGFAAYVAAHIEDEPEQIVQALHVIRAELDRVLTMEFEGRRMRFVGDCIHGLMCSGTAQTTDEEESVSDATLCAGALRSSFNLALNKLDEAGIDVEGLGLAIGFELGPMMMTRLGMKGDRVRVGVSRGVIESEAQQKRCAGDETAIGAAAAKAGSQQVRDLFGVSRKVADLDYDEAVDALANEGDETASAARKMAFVATSPAIARSAERVIKPYLAPRDE